MSLQDANAIAEVDVESAEVTAVRGLGFKDHGLAGSGLDASDRDNAVNICTWQGLYGMYQPDAISAFTRRGRTYLVSANEGDSRAADEARVGALSVSSALTPFRANQNLGRLTVNRTLGAVAGVHQELYVYGARSFSIWNDSGELVYDSGDELERIAAAFPPAPPSPIRRAAPVPAAPAATCPLAAPASPVPSPATPFNSNHEESPSFDNRSDNKGPEPEAATLGEARGRTYAFIGLERLSGVAVYDVTDPAAPEFQSYVNRRDFAQPPAVGGVPNPAAGDLGPEGMAFVPKAQSPSREPLLVVANEVSGTTTIYELSTTK